MHTVRRSSRPCLRRRARAHWAALLHELRLAPLCEARIKAAAKTLHLPAAPVINISMSTASATPAFREPTPIEKFLNRVMGSLVSLGLAPSHMRLLQVRGRRSGKLYSTPVDLLELNGKLYLVAPRGRTQWVRNAEAAGEITLKRGSDLRRFRLRALSEEEKLPILKAYLDSFKSEVQRYFPIAAGSKSEEFISIASNYPAFELLA
jgi:deazaflavin-dependent oxidoreductase (nitroreductase family)